MKVMEVNWNKVKINGQGWIQWSPDGVVGGKGDFSTPKASRPSLRPSQPAYFMGLGGAFHQQ